MMFHSGAEATRAAARRWLANSATIAFISILCAVVVGHDLLRTWEDRSRELESTRREVANLSSAVGEHAEVAFLLASRTLSELAERVKTDGSGKEQLARLNRLMAQQVATSPVFQSLSLVDPTGRIIADSRPSIPTVNVSD